jgi:hypothetical protein
LENFRFSVYNNGLDFVDWFLREGYMAERYGATPKRCSLENIMNFGEGFLRGQR